MAIYSRYSALAMNSRAGPVLLLAVTAAICSRASFALLADPEGPNLVVVTGLATIIYQIALSIYLSPVLPKLTGWRRGGATVMVQILTAAIVSVLMH